MIFQSINHKMPIYKDCTLGEMMVVGSGLFLLGALFLSLLTKAFFNYASIGFAITFILLVPMTRLVMNYLQRIKYGKPYGYYKHLAIKKLAESGIIKSSYLTRLGKWSVRRE